MADTKQTKTQTPSGKEKTRAKSEPSATAAKTKEDRGLLAEVAEDIGEGAKKAGKKATEFTDRAVDRLKKGLSQAYDAGAKVVDELSHTAQQYAEKYKAESEIKKLESEKDQMTIHLGQSIFKHHLAGGGFTEAFFNSKEIFDQISRIETIDKKIIQTGRRLDQGKTKSKQDK